jgi:hypothetical protein
MTAATAAAVFAPTKTAVIGSSVTLRSISISA